VTQRYLLFIWQRFFAAALVLFALPGFAAEPQRRSARVGFVHPQSPSTAVRGISAFWKRLHELGYVEGQNLVIEARWAEGRSDRQPALMAEVIGPASCRRASQPHRQPSQKGHHAGTQTDLRALQQGAATRLA